MRLLLPLALLGCRIPPGDVPDSPVDPGPPELTSLAWGCDADGDRWERLADTLSWTGGGTRWLTADGSYVERHTVRSIRAEPDGSADQVRVRLDGEPDWRLVQPGSSTAFTCGAPPDGLFVVFDLAGEPADCAWLGPGQAWMSVDGLPGCDDPYVP